jgi:multiple sugar transport system substrate-binding protein
MSKKLPRRDFLKLGLVASSAAALAACAPNAVGGTAAPATATGAPVAAGAKKLIFSSYTWSGYDVAINKVIDSWIATQPAGSVEVERQFADQASYWDKLQTQIAAGTPPDLGIADYARFISYAKNGTLLNITDRLKNSDLDLTKFMPVALGQYRWAPGDFDSGNANGDYYGIPSDAQAQIFCYNKKMFDAAGVAYPTDDWTWDDMLAAAMKLTDPAKEQFGFFIDPFLLWKGVWTRAAGGSIISADYKKSMLTAPETKEAITWLWDAIYTHKVATPPPPPNSNQPFLERKVAMTVDGVWWVPDFNKGLEPGEYDIAMLPKHPKTGKRTTSVESDGWWIFKGSKEPDLAFSLLKYMASPSGQATFTEMGYIIPSCLPEIAIPWYAVKPPEDKPKVLENITTDSIKVGYSYFEVATINNVVQPKLLEAFSNGADIGQVLQDADAAMNAELDTAWALFQS